MSDNRELRAVIFRDGDVWIAQCLEYDIGARATDIDELLDRFDLTVKLERKESIERTGQPFGGIGPAPRAYQEMWEKCSGELVRRAKDSEPEPPDGRAPVKLMLCA